MEFVFVFEKRWENDEGSGYYFGNVAKTLEGAFAAAKNYVWHYEDDKFTLGETDGSLWKVLYENDEIGEISKCLLDE